MIINTVQREPFAGPKLKIERAKRHITEYRAALQTFANFNIARIGTDLNPEIKCHQLKVGLTEPLPDELRLAAADALYNLRSALDQVVCCCAKLAGQSPKSTYFPHGRTKPNFEISLREKCKKWPAPGLDDTRLS